MSANLVQSKELIQGTANTSNDIAFTSNLTAGSLLVAFVSAVREGAGDAGDIIATPTDTKSHTWVRATAAERINPSLTNRHHVAMFYVENCQAGACTVTIADAGPANCWWNVTLAEYSGIETTSAEDAEAAAFGSNSSSTAVSTGNSGTLGQADELLVGMFGHSGTETTITPSNTEIHEDETDTAVAGASQYKIVSATTATDLSWTLGAARSWVAILAGFKIAAGGGGGAPPLLLKKKRAA